MDFPDFVRINPVLGIWVVFGRLVLEMLLVELE